MQVLLEPSRIPDHCIYCEEVSKVSTLTKKRLSNYDGKLPFTDLFNRRNFWFHIIFQGIQAPDQKLPEDLSRLFSKETLVKLGLTEYHIKLYTEKMEKIIKKANEVG